MIGFACLVFVMSRVAKGLSFHVQIKSLVFRCCNQVNPGKAIPVVPTMPPVDSDDSDGADWGGHKRRKKRASPGAGMVPGAALEAPPIAMPDGGVGEDEFEHVIFDDDIGDDDWEDGKLEAALASIVEESAGEPSRPRAARRVSAAIPGVDASDVSGSEGGDGIDPYEDYMEGLGAGDPSLAWPDLPTNLLVKDPDAFDS